MHLCTLLSLIVIADVFWAPKPLHAICIVIAFEFAAWSFKIMAAEISEEVKKTWPRKGDCVRCLFGTVQHEGVMLSCSPSKGTCKVEFTRGVDSVNLKRTKWGVILKEKEKGRG